MATRAQLVSGSTHTCLNGMMPEVQKFLYEESKQVPIYKPSECRARLFKKKFGYKKASISSCFVWKPSLNVFPILILAFKLWLVGFHVTGAGCLDLNKSQHSYRSGENGLIPRDASICKPTVGIGYLATSVSLEGLFLISGCPLERHGG